MFDVIVARLVEPLAMNALKEVSTDGLSGSALQIWSAPATPLNVAPELRAGVPKILQKPRETHVYL